MKSPLLQLLLRWLVLALGVTLATKIVPGITCADGRTLLVVVVLLSFCNAILKPLLLLFTLPFILLTMGLGIVVINALLFLWVGRLVDGFVVTGFWAAMGGSLVVSITNLLLSAFVGGGGGRTPRGSQKPARKAKGGDVIDI